MALNYFSDTATGALIVSLVTVALIVLVLVFPPIKK
jgi:hypothetical protein